MGSERMGTALDSSTTDKVATEFKEGGADILHTEEYVVRLRSTGSPGQKWLWSVGTFSLFRRREN